MHDAALAGHETVGVAVGTLMLTSEWSDWRNGDWWWIQSVYVPEAHRRGGVFAAMYRHVEQLARATPGVIGLRLYVETDNAAAQRTYAALGMQDAGYAMYEQRTDETRQLQLGGIPCAQCANVTGTPCAPSTAANWRWRAWN